MLRLCLTFTLALLLALPASAAAVKSAKSGNWSDPKAWDGGKDPAAGDTVLVRQGHAVTYDVKSDAVIRALFIVGTVTFAPDRDTELNVGLVSYISHSFPIFQWDVAKTAVMVRPSSGSALEAVR